MTKPVINLMIDLETLGLSPGCKILQLGAATFSVDSRAKRELFSYHISRESQIHLSEDRQTLEWWNKQDRELREQVLNPKNSSELIHVLQRFSEWISKFREQGYAVRVWGNAASFDLSILARAYQSVNLPVPWKYFEEMCFRTLKNLFGGLEPEFVGVKHNALDDAVHQAVWAERIFNAHRLKWE